MVGFKALGSQIADELRSEIVTGQLKPGDRVVETELADRFDVSRGPVRDAIKDLATEGLVEIRRGRAYVVGMSDEDLTELYSLRDALETLAVRRVVAGRQDVDWAVFEEGVRQLRVAADARDPGAFAEADLLFHDAIYTASGHRRLIGTWRQIRPTFSALLTLNARARDLQPSVAVHERLLKSIRTGGQAKVVAEVSRHLELSQERIASVLRRPSD